MVPEHVKRQAMDAVAAYESTPFIRRHSHAAETVRLLAAPSDEQPAKRGIVTDEIRKLALDAVAPCKRDVRLVPHDGTAFAMHTPNTRAARSAEWITQLNRQGAHVDTVHRMATKDYFGRDHD